MICVLFVSVAIATFLARLIVSTIQQKVRRFSKLTLYQTILRQGRTDDILDPGQLESFIATFSFSARAIFSDSLTLCVTVLSLITVISVFLADLSCFMSVCYLTSSLLFLPLSYYCAKKNTLNIAGCVTLTAHVTQVMIDVFSKLTLVRAFRTATFETEFMDEKLTKEEDQYQHTQIVTERNTFVQSLVLALLNGSLIFYAVSLLKEGSVKVGDLLFIVSALLLASNTLSGVGERLLAFFEYLNRLKAASEGIRVLLSSSNPALQSNNKVSQNELYAVEIKQGIFPIAQEKNLSSPLSLKIQRGSLTLINGPNGAGKTSLLRVLMGELLLHAGELHWFVDPYHIVYSPQSAHLFNRSLIKNLTYGSKATRLDPELKSLLPRTLIKRLEETVGSQSIARHL